MSGGTTSAKHGNRSIEPQWHTYRRRRDGVYVREVTKTNKRVVTTVMGRIAPRSGESAADSAERAYLRSAERPEPGGGREVRVADLFSGCGGLSLGVWEACRALGLSAKPVAAFDNSPSALDIYRTNFSPSHLLADDVGALLQGNLRTKASAGERRLRRKVRDLELLVAGPPCQGFTALNHSTRGTDKRNRLYERVARLAALCSPSHIVIENIVAVSTRTQPVVLRTVEALTRLGYSVTELVIPLVDLGVAQRRRRHVLVATTKSDFDVRGVIDDLRAGPRDLRWAIDDLRTERATIFDSASDPSPDNAARMEYLRRTAKYDLPNRRRPVCHQGEHTYVSMYGRLKWDEPAQTITSGYGSMGQGRYVHPTGRRTLTPHEAARLQFFPDWFDFGERRRTDYAEAIGNAVPMKLSYALAVALLR